MSGLSPLRHDIHASAPQSTQTTQAAPTSAPRPQQIAGTPSPSFPLAAKWLSTMNPLKFAFSKIAWGMMLLGLRGKANEIPSFLKGKLAESQTFTPLREEGRKSALECLENTFHRKNPHDSRFWIIDENYINLQKSNSNLIKETGLDKLVEEHHKKRTAYANAQVGCSKNRMRNLEIHEQMAKSDALGKAKDEDAFATLQLRKKIDEVISDLNKYGGYFSDKSPTSEK